MIRQAALLSLFALAACQTATSGDEPTLARRPTEAIDPRLPVDVPVDARATDAQLSGRLEAMLAEARASAAAFAAAEPGVRAKAAQAGAPESESWVAAQLALSELERLSLEVAKASADLDELRAARARSADASSPADIAAMESAAAELLAISESQSSALAAIRAQLNS